MDKLKKDALMDELLCFMNEEIERSGSMISNIRFDFSDHGEDSISFMNASEVSYQELESVLNSCLSRNYLKYSFLDHKKNALNLTDTGQGRAISVEVAKYAPPKQEYTGINIGEFHTSGPTQIGNYNTQNIEILFSTIIEKINQSEAPDDEKKDVKSRLKAFLEHPLTNTSLGLAPSAIQTILSTLNV